MRTAGRGGGHYHILAPSDPLSSSIKTTSFFLHVKFGFRATAPQAHFFISCSLALGTSLIRFSSAPDSLTVSQSWRCKSSALRSEEYLSGLGRELEGKGGLEEGVFGRTGEVDAEGDGGGGGEGEGGGLRCCVVVGVV